MEKKVLGNQVVHRHGHRVETGDTSALDVVAYTVQVIVGAMSSQSQFQGHHQNQMMELTLLSLAGQQTV